MNYLKDKSVYLAGPIHACLDDGVGWRDAITPKLKEYGLQVEDPCKKTIDGFGEVKDDKKLIKKLIKEEKWSEVKEKFYPIVRKDLRCIDKADFIIVYYSPLIPMFGTTAEVIESSHQKKPILVKYDRKELDDFNPWITCYLKSQWLFSEWDDMFKYLGKINSGNIETSHWTL